MNSWFEPIDGEQPLTREERAEIAHWRELAAQADAELEDCID